MAGLPTITITWGELFDRIADLELALEQADDRVDQIGLESQLEPLREQERADAPGAVHAVASGLKDVIREILRLDAQIAAALRSDAGTAAFADLVSDYRDQWAKRGELKSSIDQLMREDTEGTDD